MFSDPQLLPISALQHLLFCERQCALIHLENIWVENRFTIEGRHLHKKAHDGPREVRDGVTTFRGLSLWSFRLGLVGKADVVEISDGRFQISDWPDVERAAGKPTVTGEVRPVEYKRGRPKKDNSDRVQLCAQALCLEEMLGGHVPAGALYYGKRKRRTEVAFDDALRTATEAAAAHLHELIESRLTPVAYREPKCDRCSLINLCLPDAMRPRRTASSFFERQLAANLASDGPEADI